MQLTTASYFKHIRTVGFRHAQGDIGLHFLNKRAANLREVTGSPSLPANGELLIIKVISNVGSSIFKKGSSIQICRIADGFTDIDLTKTGDRYDLTNSQPL